MWVSQSSGRKEIEWQVTGMEMDRHGSWLRAAVNNNGSNGTVHYFSSMTTASDFRADFVSRKDLSGI
jgi:hypothetical protein